MDTDTKQQLVNALAGLGSTITEAMDVIEGFVPCGHPALTVSNALVALDADDDAALAQQLETVGGFIDHVSENRGVTAYHGIEVELAGPKADLLAAIREVGALMQTAGVKNTQATSGSTAAWQHSTAPTKRPPSSSPKPLPSKLHLPKKACTLAAAVPPECRPYTQSKTLTQVSLRVAQAVGNRRAVVQQ